MPDGVDYEAFDGKPSNLIFMIAAPMDGDLHLEVLSRLMTMLMDRDFRKELLAAKSADEFLAVIDKKETEKYPDEAKAAEPEKKDGYRVLAVTASLPPALPTPIWRPRQSNRPERKWVFRQGGNQRLGRRQNVLTKKGN